VQVAALGFPSDQGSQVYIKGMCRALSRRGHQVRLACYGHGQWQWDGEFELLRTPSIPGYSRLRAGPDLVKPWLDLCLAGVVASQQADILHAHNYEAPLAALLGRRGRPIPLVYSAHTTLEEELPSYFRRRPAAALARRLGSFLDRSIPRLSDHAIALNPQTASRLIELGCRSVGVSRPGVDAEDLPLTAPICRDGPWVVYAGNPDSYQDLEVLVAAMEQVEGAGLLLVGASSFAGLDLSRIRRLRVVQESDFARVRGWLASASLAVLPRSQCSGYPIKLLNYLGMGLPTVAAAGSSQPLPGVITVENRDSRAMAAAIQRLLDNPSASVELGRLARAHVLGNCTWDSRAEELEHLYWTILDASGLGPGARQVRQYQGQGYAEPARTRHGSV
jgi:glycosyltransferase involved in cell wall biosynthesis